MAVVIEESDAGKIRGEEMTEGKRDGFDLHNRACRGNFRRRVWRNKFRLNWWLLVVSDTWNRVCSGGKP